MEEPRRSYVDTALGRMHYAEATPEGIQGAGRKAVRAAGPSTAREPGPVVLLHQTPRSWDEFREVLPMLGRERRALAPDMPGFGDSYKPAEAGSIELYARGVEAFLDALGLDRVSLVGHHTGGVVAVEIAANQPERVENLILSSTPYIDEAEREKRREHRVIDLVEVREDGSHLIELWQRRQGFYPPGRPDLLTRFVIDALELGDRVEEGHLAVGRYEMERKLPAITARSMVLAGSDDPHALPYLDTLATHLPGSRSVVLDGGMVPMPDQLPEAFARIVGEFLRGDSGAD